MSFEEENYSVIIGMEISDGMVYVMKTGIFSALMGGLNINIALLLFYPAVYRNYITFLATA